jgi:hypothetical protein
LPLLDTRAGLIRSLLEFFVFVMIAVLALNFSLILSGSRVLQRLFLFRRQ